MSELINILQMMVDNWAKIGHPAVLERFVLRNGTLQQGAKLPNGTCRMMIKECFKNATLQHLESDQDYVEGYGLRPKLGIPFLHAWNWDGRQVIDQTWDDPEDCEYLGVTFAPHIVRQHLRANKHYGLLDTGRGINTNLVFMLDPELKEIINNR